MRACGVVTGMPARRGGAACRRLRERGCWGGCCDEPADETVTRHKQRIGRRDDYREGNAAMGHIVTVAEADGLRGAVRLLMLALLPACVDAQDLTATTTRGGGQDQVGLLR